MFLKSVGIPALCGFAVLTACGGGNPLTPPSGVSPATVQSIHVLQMRPSSQSVRADVRFGLSPAALESALNSRGPGAFSEDAQKQPVLYVSDLSAQTIRLYPANMKNPTEEGSITAGLNEPINVAVDSAGTLYVANNGNNTVTEYPFGKTKPSVTLSTSLVYPNGIAVDSKGTVYVTSGASVGSCYVLEFPKGSTKPTVQVNGFGLPIGLAVDKDDNLYVGDAAYQNYKVWEVKKGSKTPKNLQLSELSDPTGVAISPANKLYVSNDADNVVLGFDLGKTSPFVTIGSGALGPYALAFQSTGAFFTGNSGSNPGSVSGFKSGKTVPFETFTNGILTPAGIAVYPPPKL